MKTDLIDKYGEAIYVGDHLRTFDKTGKEWIGDVVVIDSKIVIKGKSFQYALSTNYLTWLHPEHQMDYEIVKS